MKTTTPHVATKPTYTQGDRVRCMTDCYALINGERTLLASPGRLGTFIQCHSRDRGIVRWDGVDIQAPHSYSKFEAVGEHAWIH